MLESDLQFYIGIWRKACGLQSSRSVYRVLCEFAQLFANSFFSSQTSRLWSHCQACHESKPEIQRHLNFPCGLWQSVALWSYCALLVAFPLGFYSKAQNRSKLTLMCPTCLTAMNCLDLTSLTSLATSCHWIATDGVNLQNSLLLSPLRTQYWLFSTWSCFLSANPFWSLNSMSE